MTGDKSDMEPVGRLAFRQEGGNWCAYYAPPDTMEGAIFLGSIKLGLVKLNKALKQSFMDLMQEVVSNAFQGALGTRPDWAGPQAAPEHGRAGTS